MRRTTPAPPRLAERLLSATLAAEWAETILGDLHEEHARRASASRLAASIWYSTQALRLASRYGLRALWRVVRFERPGRASPPRGDSLMRTLGLDLKYALRSNLQRPWLAALIVLTLALGLGANAAVLAMVDALIVRPFPFPDVDRILLLSDSARDSEYRREQVAPANFLDWKRQSGRIQRLSAFSWWDVNLVGRDEPERVQGFRVSADFFPALGVQPALGRGFVADEETIGRHRRAVIGHGLWQRRFGGDQGVVGRTITLDAELYEVVGIAPQGFDFPMGAEVWAPLAFDANAAAQRTSRYLTVIGRLAPGGSLEEARAEMTVIAERLQQQHPATNRDRGVRVYTFSDGMLDPGITPILALWQTAALFVLIIGCTNVMNLLLARGAERQRDIAVRLAMGADRRRVVRELLIESAILALAAIPATVLFAWVALDALKGSMPASISRFVPGWTSMQVDLRVLAVTTLIALAAAVLFGIVPALQCTRPRLAETLKEGGRGATGGRARQRIRRALVVAEITLALPLLVASAMGAIGAHRFLYGYQGYDPERVLAMEMVLPQAAYRGDDARRDFVDRVLERFTAIPGAERAAVMNIMPARGNNNSQTLEIEGRPNADPAFPPNVDFRSATPEVFAVLGIPVHRGRGFTTADGKDTQGVVVISQSLAKKHWPNEDPLGRRLRLGTGPWLTIVGICGDIVHHWFNRRDYPTAYVPYAQSPTGNFGLVVRAAGDPAALSSAARAAVRAVDANQPVYDVMTLRAALRELTLGLQYIAAVMGVLGALALLLAAGGVYGVMAYMVAQRAHEIGVRIALGATRADVVKLTVSHTVRLAAVGVVLGVILSVLLGRVIEWGLLGTASVDARVVAALGAVLSLSALAAGYIPARRAASIDPICTLRGE
jgi:putative ABC transport system permease protein